MRSYLRMTMFVAMTLILSFNCFSTSVYEVNMVAVTSTVGEEEDDKSTRQRVPGMRVYCEISQDGILFSNMVVEEINLFEIYDENGNRIALFNDEQRFLGFIFSGAVNGRVEIRFHTDRKVLRGYLELE